MSNVRIKFSLSLVMLLVLIMSFGSVFAANVIYDLTATLGGQTLGHKQTIILTEEDSRQVKVTINPTYVNSTLEISYKWDNEAPVLVNKASKTATFTLPNLVEGRTHTLQIESIIDGSKLVDEKIESTKEVTYIGNSNRLVVYFKAATKEATTIDVELKDGNTTLKSGATVEKEIGDTLKLSATSNGTVAYVAYRWFDLNNVKQDLVAVAGSSTNIVIPSLEEGKTYRLDIRAVTEDGVASENKTYYVKIASKEVPQTKVTITGVKLNATTVQVKANIENSTFSKFLYNWNGEADKTLTTNPANITIPTTVGTHILTVKAVAADGTIGTAMYNIPVTSTTPTRPTVEEELDVESYMKENKDMEELAVSLRNDSEELEKGNKNFYELNEEVVYYVDYKNGGEDIEKEVKLVLELPLNFKIIDSYGGTVNSTEKTITWTFANGLEEGQSGTKIVKLAYTALGKSSRKYEIVYPVADIYEKNRVSDSSAVINYIYKDNETEITDEHYPYMFGDANADTFRPDDTITRAEGALVLTRIFGIDISGTKIDNNLYPDLSETYLEAQKAIVAATKLGLVNGYTDGTFKPNKEMTKAEFMKIIATYIQENAEYEDIRGLEIKENTNIKLYKNSKNVYVTGSTTVDQHWAINAVTMLVRLNMTPVGNTEKAIELDAEITRAEVAQLVNFYLMRAPADVSSSTKTQFSDVSKRHDLFADIVEATRDEHTYTITEDGYEEEYDED